MRAGLVNEAVDYAWSSAAVHIGARDEWLLLDRKSWRRIRTRRDWAYALRDPVIEAAQMKRLRRATQTGRPLGADAFVEKLEARLQRPLKR